MLPRLLAALLALALCLPHPARAADVPFTFAQAADAVSTHPLVVRARQASEELRRASGASPGLDLNPTVQLQLGPRLAPERGVEGSIAVYQGLSLRGAPRLRRRSLQAESATQAMVASEQRMTLRLTAAEAWLRVWEAQQVQKIRREQLLAAQQVQRAVEVLVKAQERTRPDLLVAQRTVEEAALGELEAEGALVAAQGRLRGELGLGADDTPVASGDPPELAPPSAEAQRRALASVEGLPAVQTRRLLAVEERLRGMEERAQRDGRLLVGAQLQRDGVGATALMGVVGFTLPVADVYVREQAARQSSALQLEGQAEDALRHARSDLQLAFHEVEHSEQVAQAIERRVLPAAEQAQAAIERAFAVGDVLLIERLEGQRALLEVRARRVQAVRERVWARVRAATMIETLSAGAPR